MGELIFWTGIFVLIFWTGIFVLIVCFIVEYARGD